MVFVCVCLIQHIVACCSGTRCVVKKFHCVCVCVCVCFCGFIDYCSFFSCSEYRLKHCF